MRTNQSHHISKTKITINELLAFFCFVFGATAPSGPRGFDVGYSKIKLQLVGKNERVGVAPNHKLSRDKQFLLSLDTKPHAFSVRSL
jgi:hypothetical protein